MAISIRKGNPVSGDDFWPRPDVVEPLLQDLVEGRGSRRLFGLRRLGKSSVLLELERRLGGRSDLRVVRVDVQALARFGDFLDMVAARLPAGRHLDQVRQKLAGNKVVRGLFHGLWARVTGQPAAMDTRGFDSEFAHYMAWAGDVEALFQAVGPMVLMIDELPYMLRNMLAAGYTPLDLERFLATLRNWRINCGVRMLLSGSVGLSAIQRLDQVNIADTIGDVIPVSLPPLAADAAADMVDALAQGAGCDDWSRTLSEAVVRHSAETWPIFLQYGADAVIKAKIRDPEAVRAVLAADVRQALDETFYQQFSTRLGRYDSDEKAARLVLKAVVGKETTGSLQFDDLDAILAPAKALDRRDDLLEALREDDFIMFDTETRTIRPASRLIGLWVRARSWGR